VRAWFAETDERTLFTSVLTRFVHTVEAGKATIRLDKLIDVLDVLGLRLALDGPPR
jgi:hypothetical protein